LSRKTFKLTYTAPDEIALYDRQIRLWGVQAQEKIRNAKILLITMKALANEIAKNLVLAGIGSLTIIDHENVTDRDLGAQFFLSETDIGTNRAVAAAPRIMRLNPRVKVLVDQDDITTKSPPYFRDFDIVIATDLQPSTLNIINTVTRVNHKAFYAAGAQGFYGFIFSDLIEHDYVIEREKSNRETLLQPETRTRRVIDAKTKKESGKLVEMVTKRELYSTWFLASDAALLPAEFRKSPRRLRAVTPLLSCLRALWEFQDTHGRLPGPTKDDLRVFTQSAAAKHKALGLPTETLRAEFLRSFMQNIGSEIAPVTAVLGGQLAQDVINVLGHRQQPIQNMVLFDGELNEAPMYALHPEGPLGRDLLPLSEGLVNKVETTPAMDQAVLPVHNIGMPA
jgi:ubiquitin-like 1-activating enzyme E1 A